MLTETIPADIGPDDQCIIGFLDESSLQTKANTQRLWSFKKPLMMKKYRLYKIKCICFYSINGSDVIDFMDSLKAINACKFLVKIVEPNPGKK